MLSWYDIALITCAVVLFVCTFAIAVTGSLLSECGVRYRGYAVYHGPDHRAMVRRAAHRYQRRMVVLVLLWVALATATAALGVTSYREGKGTDCVCRGGEMSDERHWSFNLNTGDWVNHGRKLLQVRKTHHIISPSSLEGWVTFDCGHKIELPLDDSYAPGKALEPAPGPLAPLNALRDEAHATAQSKGWHEKGDSWERFPELLVMVHAETSEAVEAYRRDLGKDAIAAELSDVVIRVLDICGLYDIDLAAAVRRKMDYNKSRPYRHGGKKV